MNYTEQNIRKLAIAFLRRHYKLRPRSGTSGTRVQARQHYYEGVVIDARLAYQKPDLSWFTATVEATSVDRAQEVLYRVNYFRVGAHALLLTLTLLTAFLALTQVQGESLWQRFGRPRVYGVLLYAFLLTLAVAGVLLSRLRGYRYIYAVAQFKRFYANAQWIAYDRRIFTDRPERYYRELQRQCMRYGFGLMEVGDERVVRWIIEPSHIDQFGGRRARLPFWVAVADKAPPLLKGLGGKRIAPPPTPAPASAPEPPTFTAHEAADPLAVEAYLPTPPRRRELKVVAPPKAGRVPWHKRPARLVSHLRWGLRRRLRTLAPDDLRRRPGYYELPWSFVAVFAATLVAFATLCYLQAEWSPERRPGQVAAAPDLGVLESAATPAASDAVPEVLADEYVHELSAEEFAVRQRLEDDATVKEAVVVPAAPVVNQIHYYHLDTAGVVERSFGCGPLGRAQLSGFLLLEGRYPTYELARERAEFLNGRFAVATSALLADCYAEGAPGYLVYLDAPVLTEADANLRLRRYATLLGLELEVVEVD